MDSDEIRAKATDSWLIAIACHRVKRTCARVLIGVCLTFKVTGAPPAFWRSVRVDRRVGRLSAHGLHT